VLMAFKLNSDICERTSIICFCALFDERWCDRYIWENKCNDGDNHRTLKRDHCAVIMSMIRPEAVKDSYK